MFYMDQKQAAYGRQPEFPSSGLQAPQVLPFGDESDECRLYTFTDKELQFLHPQLQQVDRLMSAINNATGLILAQNGLQGNWRVTKEGTGLERVD
jgi:hypothetical protein